MNKRIKKKHWLEKEIRAQREINKKLLDIIEQQNKRIDSLERIQNTNTLATNSNFDKFERQLEKLSKKKSWFGKH